MMESLGRLAAMAEGTLAPQWCDSIVDGIGTDTRENLSGQLFVALRGQRFDGHDHLKAAVDSGAAAVLVERGSPVPEGTASIEVDDTRLALGRMAAAWRQSLPQLRVVAITGTAGKTTTKDALARVCQTELSTVASPRSFNNDIGVPLTILAARSGDEVLIAEVGINAPGEIQPLADMLRPDIAVVTLVGSGHLEGLGTLEEVAKEKYLLLESLPEDGLGFLRQQNMRVPACRGSLETFGFTDASDRPILNRGPGWMEFLGQRWTIGLPGAHGALNAAAVVLVARALGVSDGSIEQGLSHFHASPQRLCRRAVGGAVVLDDSWNANPESMVATIETLPELVGRDDGLMLVLGDMLELGASSAAHHRGLAPVIEQAVRELSIRRIVLIGAEMRVLANEFGGTCGEIPVLYEPVADDEAMARIAGLAQAGEAVLLKGSRGLALERIISVMESGVAAT
ncbi:MAG: UDP-N-acetylmuramoyl-tripeptide--D-alanyl-D-alanine ligase [Planctomycetes bacterium]|nr:UDP-N-acetylmuramoyl-tripeptide--D-alanyl-D-alanine ligase [Planctomycetota bacterium]MCP4839081.1 UDP-N-acetylmuramoyl-tripeptide--D-alanyl-D-alanine ligase [Planctomycetota bacterium]